MTTRRKLIREVKMQLRAHENPEFAQQKQTYMKSEMAFLGIKTPLLRSLLDPLINNNSFHKVADFRDTVLTLWREAQFREDRYAAIEFCEAKVNDPVQTMDLLPMYEEMIVTGAWWDYVDPLAGHRLRRLLVGSPKDMKREMLVWSKCSDLWKQRSSILCQLRRKCDTDLDLLYRAIEPSLKSSEFFLRKAIGWALRDYAWTDPDEIERYVAANEDRLSGLSKREALRNIEKVRARLARSR